MVTIITRSATIYTQPTKIYARPAITYSQHATYDTRLNQLTTTPMANVPLALVLAISLCDLFTCFFFNKFAYAYFKRPFNNKDNEARKGGTYASVKHHTIPMKFEWTGEGRSNANLGTVYIYHRLNS